MRMRPWDEVARMEFALPYLGIVALWILPPLILAAISHAYCMTPNASRILTIFLIGAAFIWLGLAIYVMIAPIEDFGIVFWPMIEWIVLLAVMIIWSIESRAQPT